MSGKRYTDEFKIEAVRQMTEGGYPVKEVAQRLGVTTKSLYDWKAQFGDSRTRYHDRRIPYLLCSRDSSINRQRIPT